MLQRRGHGGAAAGERRRQCSANRVAYGPNFLAKKEARGSRVLTEGLRWTELRRRVVVGEVRAALAEKVAAGVGVECSGLGVLQASRRSRCAAWPGSGVAERRKHGVAGALCGGAVLVWRLGFVAALGVGVRVQGGPLGPIIGRR